MIYYNFYLAVLSRFIFYYNKYYIIYFTIYKKVFYKKSLLKFLKTQQKEK